MMNRQVKHNTQQFASQLEQWRNQRSVRAVMLWNTSVHSLFGVQQLVGFERRVMKQAGMPAGPISNPIVTLPFEPLEQSLQALQAGQDKLEVFLQLAQQLQLPPLWLSQSVAMYDPAHTLQKLQHHHVQIAPQAWQAYAQRLLSEGQQQLQQAIRRSGSGGAASLQGLLLARRVALQQVYPALMAQRGHWALMDDDVLLPHHWRTDFSLSNPRALSLLESLYGFGSEAQARASLGALRGMGMLAYERRARLAIQQGYYDGATRLIRDAVALGHADDLGRWLQLSPARRERLSVLLGLERSPLGGNALEVTAELLAASAP